jgi:long-subunit fatty acid transport protein
MVMGLNAFYTPREFSLGGSYDFGQFMVSIEGNLQKWSDYQFSTADTSANAAGDVYFESKPGLDYTMDDPEFDDTINYRIGVEVKLNKDASVMLGYCHEPTPIPDQSGKITNYIDMDKDMLSLGGKYTLALPAMLYKPLTIAGVFQYQKLKKYTADKEGVTGVTWVDQESYKVSGDVYAGGVSIGMAW